MSIAIIKDTQIFNSGASIRIEKGSKVLLLSKEQVKTIDTVQNNILRIDIGEGPLNNIFIDYNDVLTPTVNSANELRDSINSMLLSDNYNGGDATEQTQLAILTEIQTLTTASTAHFEKLAKPDFTRLEPIFVDESNPNMIFKGWSKTYSDEGIAAWAIQRIQKVQDVLVYEWANGNQNFTHVWNDRTSLSYGAYLSEPIVG